jgi:hypothetical protein
MDAAERQFGITIELEDFIDVRTVQDIAQRIATIIAGRKAPARSRPPHRCDSGPELDGIAKPAEDEVSLKRLVFHQVLCRASGRQSHCIEPRRVGPPSLT